MVSCINGFVCRNIQIALAGCLAGVFTTTLMAPVERFKCLLQIQLDKTGEPLVGGGRRYTGPVDVARQLYHEGGVRSVFRGTGATLLRDVPATAVYFVTYEVLKNALSSNTDSRYELRFHMLLIID